MNAPSGKVLQGECAELMAAHVPDDAIDLVVTSPPYDDLRCYDGYQFDFDAIAGQLLRVLKPGGVAVWVVGDKISGGRTLTSFRQGIAFQELGFTVHDVMIYQKLNTFCQRRNAFTPAHEFMFILSKGKPKTFNPLMKKTRNPGRRSAIGGKGVDGIGTKRMIVSSEESVRTNIWAYAVGNGTTTTDKYAFKQHKAMFPERLADDHIQAWSNPGDLVLDPMCGAGTTLKMAKLRGRRWLGIEISPKYAKLARRRVANVPDALL